MDHAATLAPGGHFAPIAFTQVLLTPHRAETGFYRDWIPVYAAETPIVPPYTPFRSISPVPAVAGPEQLWEVIGPANLAWGEGLFHRGV